MPEMPRLDGWTVVLTRASRDSAAAADALRALGASVIECPCVRIERLADASALRASLATLAQTDLLVLTSRSGADAVADALPDGFLTPVAAVGTATAERARTRGLRVIFVADRADGATLGRELPLPAGEILLARADAAAPDLPRALAARGALVREAVAYRTVRGCFGDAAAVTRAVERGRTAVVFASPSAVEGLLTGVPTPVLRRAHLVAGGPTTARRVTERVGVPARLAEGASAHAVARSIAALPEEVSA